MGEISQQAMHERNPAHRVALVTGAGRGIGAAIAEQLARDGMAVGVLDLQPELAQSVAAGIVSTGRPAMSLVADVSRRAHMERAVGQLVDNFGGLHVLVNNAGVRRDGPLATITDEDWSTVIDVHMRGAFLASQLAHVHMRKAGYGRIITISSASAMGTPNMANYSAAKAGLQGLTRTLAMDLGQYGITANAVAPGFIETDMTRGTAEHADVTFEQMKEHVAAALPVRRTGVPRDVANVVAFIASEKSGFITGQTIYVDGGQTLPRGLVELIDHH